MFPQNMSHLLKWHKKFCNAGEGGFLNYGVPSTQLHTFLQSLAFTPEMFNSIFSSPGLFLVIYQIFFFVTAICWCLNNIFKNSIFLDDQNADGSAHHNKKLDDLIRLAEMCVDQLQQNEEHYAEVSNAMVLLFFNNVTEVFGIFFWDYF